MSAIIGSLIPKIEGFQPIPNAVMIPFMEAQSAALAFAFGLNYEYGKRKVRSMSNDEFNSLTSEQITNMSNDHTHIILSKFQAQIPHVMPMQADIFTQYVAIEKLKVQENVNLAKWMVNFVAEGADELFDWLFKGAPAPTKPIPNQPPAKQPPSFTNPPPTNQPVTPPPAPPPNIPATRYTIRYSKHASGKFTTENHTLQTWTELLGSWRASILKTSGTTQKLFLSMIATVSQSLKLQTGKWY